MTDTTPGCVKAELNDKSIEIMNEPISQKQGEILLESLGKLVLKTGILRDGCIVDIPMLLSIIDGYVSIPPRVEEEEIKDIKVRLNRISTVSKGDKVLKRMINPDGKKAIKVIDDLLGRIP